jgi:uncharacterized protein (DUF1778 family)
MARQSKSAFIPVRVTPDDKLAIEKAAGREEMTVSEFMRAATLAYMTLKLDKHALNAVLTGAREMMREFEQEGKNLFLSKKLKA